MPINSTRLQAAAAGALASLILLPVLEAHQPAPNAATAAGPSPLALPVQVETRGPVRAPGASAPAGAATSGQGFWTFVAVPGVLPLPIETQPFIKGAHGTLIVDPPRDTVYWGLENIGFVGFSNRLADSWVV
ncbi:MAG: hypothetical protein J0L84_13880, partial [Verrucomicrobia bacterium]|nr:hypothetical protein [Verrucomicrobiota bacterium]